MANSKDKTSSRRQKTLHPGSSPQDAKAVGGKGDFGVAESDVAERTYTSQNTKRSDPGAAPARSGSGDSRTSGAGGNDSGPGSSSGGDLDTDIVGVGTGVGVAASGRIHEPAGPDDVTDTPSERAGGPASRPVVRGSTVQPAGEGADAASHPEDNDAFAGEVSTDEASGRNDAAD